MRIHIVIVNYGTPDLVVDCLRSLATERGQGHELSVVVVDNPSGDDSVARVTAAVAENGFGDWVDVYANDRNGGFSYGINAGVRHGLAMTPKPDAFLLLNPDTYVREGAIRTLADYVAERPEAAIAGARLEYADGSVQESRFRFPCLANEFDNTLRLGLVSRLLRRWATCPPQQETPHPIDWVSGAAMLVRRDVFERVGEFDEGFFLYFEEVDFMQRARAAGYEVHHVPASRIVHLCGQSTGVTDRSKPPSRMPDYWFESRSRYLERHHLRLYKLLLDVAHVAGLVGFRMHLSLRGRSYEGPPNLIRDFIRHNLAFWRRAFRARRRAARLRVA